MSSPRNGSLKLGLVSMAVALVFLAAACSRPPVRLDVQAPATFHLEPGGYEVAEVTRAVDGDTIVVVISSKVDGPGAGEAPLGTEQRVRLIGIDTPESVKPNSPVECFGKEAAAAAKVLLEGSEVRLVKDVEETDDFGRLLRYVYLGDESANARLVANGYAFSYTYPPNVRWSDLFAGLQHEAEANDRGLWAGDTCNGQS